MLPVQTNYLISSRSAQIFQHERDRAHVHLLRAFPRHLGPTPRAALGLLWHLDAEANRILIQSVLPPTEPSLIGERREQTELALPQADQERGFTIDIACQKTPSSSVPEELRTTVKSNRAAQQLLDPSRRHAGQQPKGSYRSAKVTVPEEDRVDWLVARLERIGLRVAPENVNLSDLELARISGKKGAIPYVTATFHGTVADPTALWKAMCMGVSAGKSYGLGLLRPQQASLPTNVQTTTQTTQKVAAS